MKIYVALGPWASWGRGCRVDGPAYTDRDLTKTIVYLPFFTH